MKFPKINPLDISTFLEKYDPDRENDALSTRGRFLSLFPLQSIETITMEQYAMGNPEFDSFCLHVESKTSAWARVKGSPAWKFGVYFGETKSDPDKTKIYRASDKFGKDLTPKAAFSIVKEELLNLIRAAKNMDFKSIDDNKLAQTFKAKILSLYFPDLYFNICSKAHLDKIANELDLPVSTYYSQCQNFLVRFKFHSISTKNWNNAKFMQFLYWKYMNTEVLEPEVRLKKPTRRHQEVDFGKLQEDWRKVGELSENFAWKWEEDRLKGLNLQELIGKMNDRTKYPSYGFDFESFSSKGVSRFIEVKSLRYDRKTGNYCFFLSENERQTSLSESKAEEYYFYLVLYKNGLPFKLEAKKASDIYLCGKLGAYSYLLSFQLEMQT